MLLLSFLWLFNADLLAILPVSAPVPRGNVVNSNSNSNSRERGDLQAVEGEER